MLDNRVSCRQPVLRVDAKAFLYQINASRVPIELIHGNKQTKLSHIWIAKNESTEISKTVFSHYCIRNGQKHTMIWDSTGPCIRASPRNFFFWSLHKRNIRAKIGE